MKGQEAQKEQRLKRHQVMPTSEHRKKETGKMSVPFYMEGWLNETTEEAPITLTHQRRSGSLG